MEDEYKLNPESPEISELFGDNFLKLNKYFVQVFGLVNAVVLCNLKEKDLYFRHFKGSSGAFFLDKKSQEKELNLSPHLLREALKNLVELNLIKVERKGIPPRYWYEINYNEIKKAIDLYRSKISTFKDENPGPINNKIKENKIKSNLKDIGETASQSTPPPLDKQNLSMEVSKKQIIQKKAERILTHFNKLRNEFRQKHNLKKSSGFGPTQENLKPIIAILNKKKTYKECIQVLENKIQDEEFVFKDWYNPETLFRAIKFQKYLDYDPTQYKKQSSTNKPSNGSGYTGTRKYKEAKVVKNVFTPWED